MPRKKAAPVVEVEKPITASVTFQESEEGRTYLAWLAPEGQETDGDGRYILGPIGWRDGRLPFTFSDVEGDPHGEARLVGNLDNLRREERDGTMWVVADLDWDDDELALEAKRLVDEDRLTGISIHPTAGEGFMVCGIPPEPTEAKIREAAEEFDWEECEDPKMVMVGLEIGSATLLMLPAFADAEVVTATLTIPGGTTITGPGITISGEGLSVSGLTFMSDNTIGTDRTVTAAADLFAPPRDWFTAQLDGPTPLTVDEDGRVFGHLALWNTCHRGFTDVCITPPRDGVDYSEFHANATCPTDQGLVNCGVLTVDVSHADVRASGQAAKRHYDHTGTVAAYVRAGDDEWGVWVAGAVRPDLDKGKVELLRRLSLSGDWRPRSGTYYLLAAQAVPVPGFPVRALVAAGVQELLTTVGPKSVYVPPEPTDLALVASAIELLSEKVESLAEELAQERRRRELAEMLTLFEDQPVT